MRLRMPYRCMSKHDTFTTLRQLKEFAEEAKGLATGRSREDRAIDC